MNTGKIHHGIGKLTPRLWARLMRALKWYKRNHRNLKALMREAKQQSGLPEQPAIIIATLQPKKYSASYEYSRGTPATEECEWLDNHSGDCGDDSDDVCTGPCVKYKEMFAGRTIPTNTCMYYWHSVVWGRDELTSEATGHWYTQPTDERVEWFESFPLGSADPYYPPWYGGGTADQGEPSDDEENHGDGYYPTNSYFAPHAVGLPPAINVAVLGAVKNSEHEAPTGSPGWDHWWSFRDSSNCRFKQAPFNGMLPPAMKLGKYIDEDGEEQSTTWTDFNPIVIQPINHPPMVPLHIFMGDYRSSNYVKNWSTETTATERESNMTYPFFCCTQLYTGGGCCC